jgi:uncharacterized protein (UPF0248 family)
MVPIQDVLHRIRWDAAWRGGRFEIGYLDRVAGRVVRVPVTERLLDAARPESLAVHGADGVAFSLPLHRVRQVWRDGAIIWERRPGEAIQSPHGRDPHD